MGPGGPPEAVSTAPWPPGEGPCCCAFSDGGLLRAQIREFMIQYYHYVRRFIGWIGLLLAHAEDDRVRFSRRRISADEINDRMTRSSHRTLLIELLMRLGIDEEELWASRPRPETARCERDSWDRTRRAGLQGLFARPGH